MSRRIALASLLIALALGLVLLLVIHSSRSQAVEVPESKPAAVEAGPIPTRSALEHSATEPSDALDPSNAQPTASREPAAGLDPGVETVELRGTVVVSDSHGIEHPSENGYFYLYAPEVQIVEVNHGSWSARIPKQAQSFGIRHVYMDDKLAVSERTGMIAIPVPRSLSLELRVSWPPPVLIHVQARETGLELDHVELVRQPKFSSSTSSHPGNFTTDDVVLAEAASPICLELDRVEKETVPGAIETYYVRAPGYAWEHVPVNFLAGGEKTAVLDRAGDLDVLLEGIMAPKNSYLRVRKRARRSDWVEAEFSIRNKTSIPIESLSAGVHTVSVEVGNRNGDEGPVLASKEVRLAAGERTTLHLVLEQPPPVHKVPLEGQLVLPAEWGISEFRLGATLVKPDGGSDRSASLSSMGMHRASDEAESWNFAFVGVRPGVQELFLDKLKWTIRVQVGDEGRKDLRLEVPRPAQVSLRLVESESGKDASIDAIQWRVTQSEDAGTRATQWVRASNDRGRFEFRAPSGTLTVETQDDAFEEFSKSVVLTPGPNHVEFEIAKACGVSLCVRDRGETKFLDGAFVLRRLDGKGRSVRDAYDLPRLRITVSAPGRYRLTILDQPGYARVPPREIQIEPGRFIDVDVDLQRSP